MSLSKIKVLLLNVNREGWHSGNMIYDMEVVKRACDTVIYGPGWPNFINVDIFEIIKQVYGNDKPDIIYSYFHEKECIGDVYVKHYNIPDHLKFFPKNLGKVNNIVKIFAISDFWFRKDQELLKESKFDYCFGCFVPPYSSHKDFYSFFSDYNRQEIKFIPCVRCVDKNCYKNYGLVKKYDVTSVGSMSTFYPLRVYMHEYFNAHKEQLKIVYKNFAHCGYNFSHSKFTRENYARAISESKMLISCGGIYHLAMNKIFEAMGCGSVYVGEKPYGYNELHLEDGYNYIAVNRENFIDKIRYYLSSINEMSNIVNNAKETFDKYYHIDVRAIDFVNLIHENLGK